MEEDNKDTEKIIVCCGVKGRIMSFIDHLEGLFVEEGLFDYVFCIGDFFGDDESSEEEWKRFIASGKTISVPTYTLGPNTKQHEKYFENLQDQRLAPNIYYLGHHGVFTTSKGVQIGYISGIQTNRTNNEIHTFNYDTVAELKDNCVQTGKTPLDVLLSSPWPLDIYQEDEFTFLDKVTEKPYDKGSVSPFLSWVDINLSPRYYFAGMQEMSYYKRFPHKNPITKRLSRFIGLSDYQGTEKKSKWIYGLLMAPNEHIYTDKISSNIFQSPYSTDPFRYINMVRVSNKCLSEDENVNRINEPPNMIGSRQLVTKRSSQMNSEKCWFCLCSKNITQHLLITAGDQIYLANTKGPLVKEHLILATNDHYKSIVHAPPETENEINLLKSALNQYYASSGRVAVFFERNIISFHFQLHVIPIPIKKADCLENLFKNKFEEYGLSLVDISPVNLMDQMKAKNGKNYFYVELPNGKCLFHNYDIKQTNFPIHIAREILASPDLLNIQDRIDWKKCLQSEADEVTDVHTFSEAFASFNPFKDKNQD